MSFCGGSYLSLPSLLNVNGKSLDCFPQVFRRCKATGSMLDTVDASSMLCRLEMEGKKRADVRVLRGPRWRWSHCIKDDEMEAQPSLWSSSIACHMRCLGLTAVCKISEAHWWAGGRCCNICQCVAKWGEGPSAAFNLRWFKIGWS